MKDRTGASWVICYDTIEQQFVRMQGKGKTPICAMEVHIALDPVNVCGLGADTVVFEPTAIPHAKDQPSALPRRNSLGLASDQARRRGAQDSQVGELDAGNVFQYPITRQRTCFFTPAAVDF